MSSSLGAGSIHDGVDERIDRALRLHSGKCPRYRGKRVAQDLSGSPSGGFDGAALVSTLYAQIEHNGRSATRKPSAKNWRFEKQLEISKKNKSSEKQLEKAIVKIAGADWANQVPTASGLVTSHERQRNIDLVHRAGEGVYELIELKWGADTPLYAALEALKNALVFFYSRRHRDEFGYRSEASPLLWASRIGVRVLAPRQFYVDYDFAWLEEGLSRGVARLGAECGVPADFAFERFPAGFAWPCPDSDLLSALAARRRLYGDRIHEA